MRSSRPRSLFQDISSRELNGLRVRKRPHFDIDSSNPTQIGAVSVVHAGECTLPLSVSFCKNTRNAHILAVSDEYGCVNVYNTSRKLTQFACYEESAEKARVCEWVAHQNSIFDVCWIKEDTSILTASGDQTIKVWDAQEQKCSGVLMGHVGSVKSLCPHPTNPDLIVSGSRDGSFALWDLRCNSSSKSSCCKVDIRSTAMVKRAHISHGKRVRQGKAASMSITSVLYLKDEVSLATAGAVDNILKFWDTRNLKSLLTQTCPHQESSTNKERRLHGISSLSQDSNGLYLSASCRDNRIYMYDVLSLEKGPFVSFSGSQIGSFFVKSTISPDGAHILSGSSDGNAYIWQVNKPNADPIVLKGHDGEVSSVDWSSFEDGKVATSSDDFTVRFWDIESSHSSTKSPSAIRRRVMALPSMECRRLFNDEEEEKLTGQTRSHESMHYISNMECRKLFIDEVAASETNNHGGLNPIPSDETLAHQLNSPKINAPESQQVKLPSDLSSIEAFAKTPEVAVRSSSPVLNPPTRKKTIRDYFLSAS